VSFVEEEIMSTTTTGLLRLHVDHNSVVWYGRGDAVGTNSHCGVDEFMKPRSDLTGLSEVRITGSGDNAKLILALTRIKATQPKGQLPRVRVCQPLLTSNDPLTILHDLRQPQYCRAVLWHDLSVECDAIYSLLSELQNNKWIPDEKCKRILQYHPAWPALSFPVTCDPFYACKLVAHIVDPRWFRDLSRPHRCNKLLSFLGVNLENVKAYHNGLASNGRHYERFMDTVYAWCGRTSGKASTGASPRSFLQTIESRAKNKLVGTLKATTSFVRLVSLVWLDNLHYRRSEPRFMPAMFFKTVQEIEQFNKHVEQLRNRRP
jgi:hypothetical protein